MGADMEIRGGKKRDSNYMASGKSLKPGDHFSGYYNEILT
jgi:hypothetical protein